MPKDFSRTERVAAVIQNELAKILAREIDDPRLRHTNIISVEVSKDLAYAKIYVTWRDDESAVKEKLSIANRASSYLRTLLAKSTKLRIVPQLRFVYDNSINYGTRLSALIDSVLETDPKHSQEE